MRDGCPFCDYDGPSDVLSEWVVMEGEAFRAAEPSERSISVLAPLDPVTPGHLLVVPREHVADFRSSPFLLGQAMCVAAEVARDIIDIHTGCNLIVSAGEAATQTVPHVHVHVVPRREGDGLLLPWSKNVELSRALLSLVGEETGLTVSQWTCPKDGCDYVHETRARLGATPTPKCPRHEVPMLLAGWR